jgi:hypothetical protein
MKRVKQTVFYYYRGLGMVVQIILTTTSGTKINSSGHSVCNSMEKHLNGRKG